MNIETHGMWLDVDSMIFYKRNHLLAVIKQMIAKIPSTREILERLVTMKGQNMVNKSSLEEPLKTKKPLSE